MGNRASAAASFKQMLVQDLPPSCSQASLPLYKETKHEVFLLSSSPTDDCSRTHTRYTSGSTTDTDSEDTTLASLKVLPKGFHCEMHRAAILTAAFSCCVLLLSAPLMPPLLSSMHLVQLN